GRTRVRNEYVVSAPVGGRLLRIGFKPGAAVRAGDIVARILPGAPAFLDSRAFAEAQAVVRAAEAAVSAARTELERAEEQESFSRSEAERIESLRNRNLASAEEFERARLGLRIAESAAASARENIRIREADLEAAVVRLTQPGSAAAGDATVEVVAPVSGRVLRVARESETIIAAGAEVMTLGDPSDLEVVIEMLSTDAVQVKEGADAFIENWGRRGEPLHGRVRLVEPYGFLKISALGVEEQRVNVIVDFTGPPADWSTLGHGYRVEVAVVTWTADDAIQVPVAALFRSSGDWAVFHVVGERAVLTAVEIGRDNGRNAQVLQGLEAGDTVVLYPGDQVQDGVGLRPRDDAR
ncbi:MAG: HlyD family efflux transporter periplasmic adaptor subunit, partial [Woeseiaceae bacterium]|nr:HlyD family efflux transporter periplasmic adaptor subunit [Woeseiaceae bacterium]